MVINNTYDYNQNGQTVENQLYYSNDLRIQQYKASFFFLFSVSIVRAGLMIKLSNTKWLTSLDHSEPFVLSLKYPLR